MLKVGTIILICTIVVAGIFLIWIIKSAKKDAKEGGFSAK